MIDPSVYAKHLKSKKTEYFCTNCGAFLNKQEGFTEMETSWICEECGFENSITEKDIYVRAK